MPHFNEEVKKNDIQRTGYLNNQGIEILRFENWEVFEKTVEVLEKIKNSFKEINLKI